MYMSDLKFEVNVPSEVTAFRQDRESLSVINDLEHWYVTERWAGKFREHLSQLQPLAESGNILAQYSVACIHMLGYCYASEEAFMSNWLSLDAPEMSKWLIRAARQGYLCALDNLCTTGIGPEADLVRSVSKKISQEIKEGHVFLSGETWRRVFGGQEGL